MKTKICTVCLIMVCAVVLSVAPPCIAGIGFSLSPSTVSVATNEAVFSGWITNTSLTDKLFLNDVSIAFSGVASNYFLPGTNAFFENVPGILMPGENYGDVVFKVEVLPFAPLGTYSGTASILGGTNIFDNTVLISQPFQIGLTPSALAVKSTGTNLTAAWATPPAGAVLQASTNLSNANWMAVTNTVSIANSSSQVVLPLPSGNMFYRLLYP